MQWHAPLRDYEITRLEELEEFLPLEMIKYRCEKVMSFGFKMMHFVIKMMNCALKMTIFAFKMMTFALKMIKYRREAMWSELIDE